VPNAFSSAVLRWGGGGDIQARESVLNFRSYDQGREKFQADTVDFFWLDEEPDHDIYMECLTRTNAVEGPVFLTFTPLKGMSQTVMRFMIEKPVGTIVITMGIHDSERYSPEQADRIVAQYPPHEREARAFGRPVLGSGAVFPVLPELITCTPFRIPGHWPRICGLDLGWDHPTAAAWVAVDTDKDPHVVYVYDCYKASQQAASAHAQVLRGRGQWIPVAWPHDALQTQKDTGVPMRDAYVREGVNMLPERAQFEDGSYGVEPGVQIIYNMMMSGHFKVFSHLTEWFSEFSMYHRKDGKIVPLMDDLMSATRYAVMSLRFAVAEQVRKLNVWRDSWRA
jgi:phage terminase large subunit-like protein